MRSLSLAHARRLALAAQGFADPPPRGRVDIRHLRRVVDRVALIQIDSVNVLARSHYLPLFSRLGPYRPELLDEAAYTRRELFEYWAHAASFLPVEHHRLLRHRMARTARPDGREAALAPGYVDAVEAEVAERGPLVFSELSDPGSSDGPWWGWAKGKIACEWLFAQGRLAVAGRRNFARLYDIAERVIPPDVLAAPTPSPEEALRELIDIAARAHGVATAGDLLDYHRLRDPGARPLVRRMAAEGLLEQVEVEGWTEPAYAHPQARMPRRVEAAALLSPFDSLVWERARTERLFGFRYRLEIYVPEPKRVYGYYVLPFLLGDALVGRVDLKADRVGKRLLVRRSWVEPGADADHVAWAMAGELARMASWLGLDAVEVAACGNLAPALAAACR